MPEMQAIEISDGNDGAPPILNVRGPFFNRMHNLKGHDTRHSK